MTKLHHDSAALFFGLAALLTLAVSIPATFALLRPFHDAGGWGGWALALFAMLVFELGAVGAKLITIAIPQWRWHLTALTVVLLLLTTIGNYLHGAELFRAAALPPTLAQLRAAGYGPWLVGGSAALFPALLFIWLFAFVARVEMIGHLNSREQQLAGREQVLVLLEQDLERREQALINREQRPIRLEQVETIRIATAELTWKQFEQVVSKALASKAGSLGTLRRLVSSVEQEGN